MRGEQGSDENSDDVEEEGEEDDDDEGEEEEEEEEETDDDEADDYDTYDYTSPEDSPSAAKNVPYDSLHATYLSKTRGVYEAASQEEDDEEEEDDEGDEGDEEGEGEGEEDYYNNDSHEIKYLRKVEKLAQEEDNYYQALREREQQSKADTIVNSLLSKNSSHMKKSVPPPITTDISPK